MNKAWLLLLVLFLIPNVSSYMEKFSNSSQNVIMQYKMDDADAQTSIADSGTVNAVMTSSVNLQHFNATVNGRSVRFANGTAAWSASTASFGTVSPLNGTSGFSLCAYIFNRNLADGKYPGVLISRSASGLDLVIRNDVTTHYMTGIVQTVGGQSADTSSVIMLDNIPLLYCFTYDSFKVRYWVNGSLIYEGSPSGGGGRVNLGGEANYKNWISNFDASSISNSIAFGEITVFNNTNLTSSNISSMSNYSGVAGGGGVVDNNGRLFVEYGIVPIFNSSGWINSSKATDTDFASVAYFYPYVNSSFGVSFTGYPLGVYVSSVEYGVNVNSIYCINIRSSMYYKNANNSWINLGVIDPDCNYKAGNVSVNDVVKNLIIVFSNVGGDWWYGDRVNVEYLQPRGNPYFVNSFNMSFFNAFTGFLITDNVSVSLVSSSNISNYSSSMGRLFVTNYSSSGGDIELKVSSGVFAESRQTIGIVNGNYVENVSFYLVPSNSSTNFSLTFYDHNSLAQEGVFVGQSILLPGGYVVNSEGYTDINGMIYFSYNPSYYYSYSYSKVGFVSDSFILNPPRVSNYDVYMSFSSGGVSYTSLNVSGFSYYDNVSDLLGYSYLSNNVLVSSYNFRVYNSGGNVICNNVSGVFPYSLFYCNMSGYHGSNVFVQGLADGVTFYGSYVQIPGSNSLAGVLDGLDSAYITGFIMLIIIFAGLTFGVVGVGVSGVIALCGVFWLGIFSWVTPTMIILDVIVTVVIILGFKRRF